MKERLAKNKHDQAVTLFVTSETEESLEEKAIDCLTVRKIRHEIPGWATFDLVAGDSEKNEIRSFVISTPIGKDWEEDWQAYLEVLALEDVRSLAAFDTSAFESALLDCEQVSKSFGLDVAVKARDAQ